ADSMIGRVRDVIGTKEQFAQTLRHPDALAERVNQWIDDGGGFRQKAVWHGGWPQWQREVHSLYAAIGVGLWNVIGDITTGPRCKHCDQVLQPKSSRQLYCDQKACQQARKRENQQHSRANRAAQANER
ncbi:MAG: hypothetical protein KY456_11970, partial [Chloroflexi bacterium]|nr:hypothetical protein [Chloroflexota bacterium]